MTEALVKRQDTEMSVIGGLLLSDNQEHIEQVFSRITPKCFTYENLRIAYETIRKDYQEHKKIDLTITLNQLGDEYKEILVQCMDLVPVSSLLPQYSALLFDNYRRNTLDYGLGKLGEKLIAGAPTSELMAELNRIITVQEKFDEIQLNTTSLDFLDSIIEYMKHLYSEKQASYKTGIGLLDYMLAGFRGGEVTALSGRSGMGKSDMAIFLATQLAVKGVRVLYLTMEMKRVQIMNRIASRVTKVDSSLLLETDKIDDGKKQSIAFALDKICKIPLIFDEQQNISVYDVQSKIAKHKPQVVFIDHIGLMAQDKYKKQWESISETSKALKQIAMKENIALVELVQQNTEVERRKEKHGKLSDLKGTDAIGNDCDNVMFIYADKDNTILSGDMWVDTELQIVKNRNSKTGTIKFHWFPQYHSYKQVEER